MGCALHCFKKNGTLDEIPEAAVLIPWPTDSEDCIPEKVAGPSLAPQTTKGGAREKEGQCSGVCLGVPGEFS